MTQVLTLRIDSKILAAAEARASRLGLSRSGYVRALVEEDVKGGSRPPAAFASEDLVGKYEGTGTAATNGAVRDRLRHRRAR